MLNDSDAVALPGGPYGHNAIAVGNDATGWTYYSQDGYFAGGDIRPYPSASDLIKNKRGRYDRSFRITTSPKEDAIMRHTAASNINNPYNPNPMSSSRYHCGDLVNDTLQSVGIRNGEVFPYAPNDSFDNIQRLNQPGF